MQWLVTIQTDKDPITTCRLVNIFRRKGVQVLNLAMAAQSSGFSVISVVETPESEAEHVYNFLRRMEGVTYVAYYRHAGSDEASFIFVDAATDRGRLARFLETYPEATLIFASHGKYLFELPAKDRSCANGQSLNETEFFPLACMRSSRQLAESEMLSAPAL